MENRTEPQVDFGQMNDEELRQWLAEKYPGRSVERDGDEIVVTISVSFHRRNGQQVIKTNVSKSDQGNIADVNESVASTLAKAFLWQEELESGNYASIAELAAAKDVGRTYVGRVMRLTSLSPVLVEKIFDGDESHGLSLRQLHKGIPILWCDQK